jgi:hypothetical protein
MNNQLLKAEKIRIGRETGNLDLRKLEKEKRSTLQIMTTMTNTQTVERKNSHTDRPNQPGSFDPVGFTVVPPRRFEDLRVADVFRAPSRTLTDEIPQ